MRQVETKAKAFLLKIDRRIALPHGQRHVPTSDPARAESIMIREAGCALLLWLRRRRILGSAGLLIHGSQLPFQLHELLQLFDRRQRGR